MDFLVNLISNVLANVIFWFGLGLVIWIGIRITQSRFLKFFGLEFNRTLIVYLSNLWEPTTRKPEGYVISGHEFRVSESVNSLFGSTPFRFPELVRGLVDSFWIGKKLKILTTVCPLTLEDITFTQNMIIIGATPRNIVRRYYVKTGPPYLIFSKELKEIGDDADQLATPWVQVIKGHRKSDRIEGDYNLAIVEKLYDEEHKTVVFMCLGERADSSWTATEYLVRHWGKLSKKFGDKEFALCLGFPMSESYMDDYEEPRILASFPF
jgi:hypothetical protein